MAKSSVLTQTEIVKELIVFGLRMNEGISTKFLGRSGSNFNTYFNEEKLIELVEQGLLLLTNDGEKNHIRATAKGFLVIDRILAEILSV